MVCTLHRAKMSYTAQSVAGMGGPEQRHDCSTGLPSTHLPYSTYRELGVLTSLL